MVRKIFQWIGGRTDEELSTARKFEAIIADLKQIKVIITEKKPDNKKPDRSEFERALQILTQIIDYFKSIGRDSDYVPSLMVIKNEISNVIGFLEKRITNETYPGLRAHFVREINEIIAILKVRLKRM